MSHSLRSLPSDLKNLLSDSVLVSPDKCGRIDLVEMDPSAKMTVEITDSPSDIVTVGLHKFSHFSTLIGENTRRKADYILVFQEGCNTHAVIIELKLNLENADRYRQQVRRSLPFFQYFRSACEINYEHKYDDSSLAMHYIVIAEKETAKFDKQPVKIDKSRWPEKECYKDIVIHKFVGVSIPFSQLSSACAAT